MHKEESYPKEMKLFGCTIETVSGDEYARFEAVNTAKAWTHALTLVDRKAGERLISIWLLGSRRKPQPPKPEQQVLRMDEKTKREVQRMIQAWRKRENHYSVSDAARQLEEYINGNAKESRRATRRSRQHGR